MTVPCKRSDTEIDCHLM